MKKNLYRQTDRLTLRPLKLSDYSLWRDTYIDLKDAKNRWDQGPKDPEDLSKFEYIKILNFQKKRRNSDTFYDLAVFTNQGEFIGQVSLMEVSRGISQTAFLGYRIFNTHWGQGFAHEAVTAIIDIGFKDLNLHRIEAGIEPRNKRSIRVAKALNMREEGLKKNALYLRSKWVSILMYTLTCEDLGIKYEFSEISQF